MPRHVIPSAPGTGADGCSSGDILASLGMNDLVDRARRYATEAHRRIDQRRKYSGQPYHDHLAAVAALVSGVCDDPAVIAAAWLHDAVEDTPATLEEIEDLFGARVAALVEQVTDVSRPGDGNRARRKALDRDHLAGATAAAKTIKLADLIDNCLDITHHDPRFARVYLQEAAALLDVLEEGDAHLLQRARQVHGECLRRLDQGNLAAGEEETDWDPRLAGSLGGEHFRRLFQELFSARDIAGGLLSFDGACSPAHVAAVLDARQREVAGIAMDGVVSGYVRRADLDVGAGDCASCRRPFKQGQVIRGEAGFSDVVQVLTRHDHCFVVVLDNVGGVISRDDINKPMMRMWLFGIVTMIEMMFVELIRENYAGDAWQEALTPGRLEKARAIQRERQRRNQHCSLLDCLQLSDKGQVLVANERLLERLGYTSRKAARRTIKELESLRNHLAHAQDIVRHDWAQIARMTRNLEEILRAG